MKIVFVFVGLFFLFAGCGDEKEVVPSFPEIENPMDQIDVLQSTLDEAVEISNLLVLEDGGLQIHRNQDGKLYSGWIKKTYKTGKIGFLFHCLNGIQDGLYTAWFENGKKMVERTWKNGMREGPFKIWSDAGILDSRGYNKENLRNGLFERFYSNGIKMCEVNYIAGKIDSFLQWKPDGSICPNTLVKEGTGIVVRYNEDGTVDSNESYYQGEIDYGRTLELNQTKPVNEGILSPPEELNSTSLPILD